VYGGGVRWSSIAGVDGGGNGDVLVLAVVDMVGSRVAVRMPETHEWQVVRRVRREELECAVKCEDPGLEIHVRASCM